MRGSVRRSQKFKNNNVTLETLARGNSVGYSLKRLRSQNPDLHRKVLAGEMSVHSAMIASGLKKPSLQMPKDIVKVGKMIKRHFSDAEISLLIEALSK